MKFILLFAGILLLFCTQSLYAQPPDVTWTNTSGGAYDDRGLSVSQTTDEGYIITGSTVVLSILCCDVYLVKTNSSGDIQWTKHFGGTDDDRGHSVQPPKAYNRAITFSLIRPYIYMGQLLTNTLALNGILGGV